MIFLNSQPDIFSIVCIIISTAFTILLAISGWLIVNLFSSLKELIKSTNEHLEFTDNRLNEHIADNTEERVDMIREFSKFKDELFKELRRSNHL